MVKQGGNSFPSTHNSKKGILERHKCGSCGRVYKQSWTKERHEKACIVHNKKPLSTITDKETLKNNIKEVKSV